MIISHKHKFIFIKTKKTAGTSLEIALSQICGKDDIITPISTDDEIVRKELGCLGPQNYFIPFKYYSKRDWSNLILTRQKKQFYNHMPANEIKRNLDAGIWENYFKFCFERNPWDKLISQYYWRKGNDRYPSIQHYLLSGEAGKLKGYELYSINNIVAVDKVYKFEDMKEALTDISERIGLKSKIEMPNYKAKGSTRKDKRNYREILSGEEAKTIATVFAREISYLDYDY